MQGTKELYAEHDYLSQTPQFRSPNQGCSTQRVAARKNESICGIMGAAADIDIRLGTHMPADVSCRQAD